MNLFGRKKTDGAATATLGIQGWKVECGPQCGFRAYDHNKEELVQILKLHMKASHKTNLKDEEAAANVQPATW